MKTSNEETYILGVPEASPDSNSRQLPLVAQRHPGKWQGACALVLVSLAIIGIVVHNGKKVSSHPNQRNLQGQSTTPIMAPPPPYQFNLCLAPEQGDTCNTEASYLQCLEVADTGCPRIAATRSCPPRYMCMVQSQIEREAETPLVPPPIDPSEGKCPLPIEGDDCATEKSYQECLGLVEDGCDVILATFSCPPQFRCGS